MKKEQHALVGNISPSEIVTGVQDWARSQGFRDKAQELYDLMILQNGRHSVRKALQEGPEALACLLRGTPLNGDLLEMFKSQPWGGIMLSHEELYIGIHNQNENLESVPNWIALADSGNAYFFLDVPKCGCRAIISRFPLPDHKRQLVKFSASCGLQYGRLHQLWIEPVLWR